MLQINEDRSIRVRRTKSQLLKPAHALSQNGLTCFRCTFRIHLGHTLLIMFLCAWTLACTIVTSSTSQLDTHRHQQASQPLDATALSDRHSHPHFPPESLIAIRSTFSFAATGLEVDHPQPAVLCTDFTYLHLPTAISF